MVASVSLGILCVGMVTHHFYVKNRLLVIEKYLDYIHRENASLSTQLSDLQSKLKNNP